MPYLITTSLYPTDKGTEVAARYQEAITKYPPNEKLFTTLVPAAIKATHQGMQVISIVEVKKGKLDEAYIYGASTMLMFQSIPGFEYRIDIYATVEDASSMSPPV